MNGHRQFEPSGTKGAANVGHAGADLEQAINERTATQPYERPADAFLSGSISSCAENGFVRNAMHPEPSAASRTAGLSFPVM
jgi:hypothetical protein